jgi:uncharacterized protein HemX
LEQFDLALCQLDDSLRYPPTKSGSDSGDFVVGMICLVIVVIAIIVSLVSYHSKANEIEARTGFRMNRWEGDVSSVEDNFDRMAEIGRSAKKNRSEIQKLRSEKQSLEGQVTDLQNRVKSLEVAVHGEPSSSGAAKPRSLTNLDPE